MEAPISGRSGSCADGNKQLVAAQSCGMQGRDNRPVLQVGGAVEDAGDLVRAQDGWRAPPLFGNCDLLVEPRLFENAHIEEPQYSPVNPKRARSVLFIVEQMEQVSTDVFRS